MVLKRITRLCFIDVLYPLRDLGKRIKLRTREETAPLTAEFQNRAEGLCLGGEESSLAGGCGSSSKKPATATTIEGSQLGTTQSRPRRALNPIIERATAGTPEEKNSFSDEEWL
ncbi:Hypothetical predicted protein [Cloeon dipterum]|uniref:Uncharacterized protein n=1 Tax=Cloeon dipterum TaxID=197152 RepID=A0A8S1DFK3_9INSE|nr:Hypothetical predicted protein [Cloeon dipterum]